MTDYEKYIIADASTQKYIVQDQHGGTVYEGEQHPLAVIFERINDLQWRMNKVCNALSLDEGDGKDD